MSSAPKKSDETVDEDATEMRFPKEFESRICDALLTSEVLLLLEHRRKQNEAKDEIDTMSEGFIKILDYARRFSRFKNCESIKAARAIFLPKPLHKFEVAQIINPYPGTAREAKAHIPSLENKLEDDDLDEILRDLHAIKTFQYTVSFKLCIISLLTYFSWSLLRILCSHFIGTCKVLNRTVKCWEISSGFP